MERWFKTLKGECIRVKTPLTLEDARRIIADFVAHYNDVRLHSAIGDVTLARNGPRNLDETVIDFDSHATRAVLLRREHHDSPVTRSQVVDHIVFRDVREREHRVRKRLRRDGEMNVGCLGHWRLRRNPENGQCGQQERKHL
jgi:hypothetical protein